MLFISGTMGLDETGVAVNDIDAQLELIWHNLRIILASAEMPSDNIVRLSSYLSASVYMEKYFCPAEIPQWAQNSDNCHYRANSNGRLAG